MTSSTNNNVDETTSPELRLPGFRFHPTEEELLNFYLKNMILGNMMSFDIITYLNIYHHDPHELPGMAKIKGEREWYFFVPRDRKHGSGGRPNRTTERGFWKATGSDRKVVSMSEPKRVIGLKKTLVFYNGRAPKGTKTEWVMNEYRFPDNCKLSKETVLCKVYMKAISLKVLEERVKMEEHMRNFQGNNTTTSPTDTFPSFSGPHQDMAQYPGPQMAQNQMALKAEVEEVVEANNSPSEKAVFEKLADIQVPSRMGMDWNTQDPLWIQLNSPWLQNPYCSNILF